MDQDGESPRRLSSLHDEDRDGGGGGPSNDKTISRISETNNNIGEGKKNAASGSSGSVINGVDTSIHPIFYYAFIFLLFSTLLQILSTLQEEAGPFDWFAGMIIPRFLSMGLSTGGVSGDDEEAFGTCPPDQWIDDAFSKSNTQRPKNERIYSPDFDPRTREVSKPSLFPHCALSRWVQLENEQQHDDCPTGQEYVTIIHPPKITKQQSKEQEEGKSIPKIIHLSTRTNCLPSSTVHALRFLAHQHISQTYTIYIHSDQTMDNFLFRREWNVFPQVKEGVLCGMKKLNALSRVALMDLKVGGNSTEEVERIAGQIGLGVKRDIWRYMVLWEYGGITLDIDTLHAILTEGGGGGGTEKSLAIKSSNASAVPGNNNNKAKEYITLRKLIQQWSSEKSDGLLYFINNVGKQRLPYNDRIPLTDIMGAAPHQPWIYYGAKIALKIAVWDSERSITDTGRTTKVPPIKDGLTRVNRSWRNTITGGVMTIANENKNTIHFVDGDVMLPPSLTSARTTPWKSIFAAFDSGKAKDRPPPMEEEINTLMRHLAAEQIYIGPKTLFSCMEYTLDMYLQKTTEK